MTGRQDATPLQKFVDQATGNVLVLHDVDCSATVSQLRGDDIVISTLGLEVSEPPGRWAAVVLAVADAAALRRAVSVLPRLGRTRATACWLSEADQAALLVPRPEWPPIINLQGRRLPSGAGFTVVRWSKPVLANAVFEELARAAVPGRVVGGAGVVVATTNRAPDAAPAADPGLLVLGSPHEAGEPELVVPPDVVITDATHASVPEHEVTGRAPAVVSASVGPVGPIDEAVLNPRGFSQVVDGEVLDLIVDDRGRFQARGADVVTLLDPVRGATARNVAELRPHRGVRVTWAHGSPEPLARVLAGLAMAGVPLTADPVPEDARGLLGARLRHALSAPADLDSALRREEHSVRLRRAALLDHSTLAWRGRLAAAAGIPHVAFPSCTIVMATRRPDQLDFALRQVARQRGVEAELVLASHGFSPDESWVRDRLGERPVVLVPMPQDALFGDVLAAGVGAASGDLIVKMDDDDWYGPDFLTDLLLARHYSGADVVGMTAEYVYVEEIDRTIRRIDDSERTAKFVAGGTIMLDHSYLNALGGFRRARRYVDASLLSAVHAAGGSVYRTHGLGYVLRRSPAGHTWDAGVDYFLDGERLGDQWEGFVPSRLLEYDAAEAPVSLVEEVAQQPSRNPGTTT